MAAIEPSDHLLRTFASVPYGSRVLDLNCRGGRHTVPLARLGFDLYACDPSETAVAGARARVAAVLGEAEANRRVTPAHPDALGYPDRFFDWIVACDAFGHVHVEEAVYDLLSEARRVLKDGGWIYCTVPAVPGAATSAGSGGAYAGDSGLVLSFTPDTLRDVMERAGFAEAQGTRRETDEGRECLQAIYRRIDARTPR